MYTFIKHLYFLLFVNWSFKRHDIVYSGHGKTKLLFNIENIIFFAMHDIFCIIIPMYIVTLQNTNCKLYSIQCIVYTIQCTPYIHNTLNCVILEIGCIGNSLYIAAMEMRYCVFSIGKYTYIVRQTYSICHIYIYQRTVFILLKCMNIQ